MTRYYRVTRKSVTSKSRNLLPGNVLFQLVQVFTIIMSKSNVTRRRGQHTFVTYDKLYRRGHHNDNWPTMIIVIREF